MERLPCTHKGTYADDCICERVKQHRCYLVATCDRDLRRRIRKIPGVPIMFIQNHRYGGSGALASHTSEVDQAPSLNRAAGEMSWMPGRAWLLLEAAQPATHDGCSTLKLFLALTYCCCRYSIERLPEATMGGAPRT